MKVLYVITGLGMGGAENQVSNLIDKMILLGHEITLISLTGPTIVKPSSEQVKLYELNMSKSPLSILKTLLMIKKIILSFKPDAVHTHMVHANILVRLVRLLTPIKKLICTAHSTLEGGWLLCLIYRFTNFLGDVFTNVSQNAVEAFEAQKIIKPGGMMCVHNGIDIDQYIFSLFKRKEYRALLNISTDCPLLVSVGSFNKAKDYPNLLHALKIIADKGTPFHLAIIGDGPLRLEITNLIAKLDLESYVSLLGVRHDVPHFMSAADYFILPSAWEGFGLVAAEAMACNCPVIATDCGGLKEVLGGHGELVPPSDSIALANGISNLMNMQKESLDLLTENARKHIVNSYSLDAVVKKWLSLYE